MATEILHENIGYGISAMTSVRRTTASSQTTIGTTRTSSSSPSTTPMTTLTHCTCTSTDAWRTCTETARIFVPRHRTSYGSSSERISHSSIVIHLAHSLWFDFSTFHFFLFLLSVTVFLFHLELFPELSYTKCVANLRLSTPKRLRTPWTPSPLPHLQSHGKHCAWGSRYFQIFSWITNVVESKSGTGFG